MEEYVLSAFVLFWVSAVQLSQVHYIHHTNPVPNMMQDIKIYLDFSSLYEAESNS